MTTELKPTADFLRNILSRIVYHPEDIEILTTIFRGAVYWNIRANADDQPKIIGKGGTHIRALTFLVAEMGLSADSMYKLKLSEPEHGQRSDSTKPPTPANYNAEPAAELLLAALETIFGKDTATIITTGTGYAFDFEIRMRDTADVPDLRTPYEDDQYEMTVIGALGTLWRGWAKKDGVEFTISSKQ
jgi:predicted RNA-binding protein YlqC (UPF0109 family)